MARCTLPTYRLSNYLGVCYQRIIFRLSRILCSHLGYCLCLVWSWSKHNPQILKTTNPDDPALEEKKKFQNLKSSENNKPNDNQTSNMPVPNQPVEEKKPKINQQALFPGNSGGQGNTGNAGNAGNPLGRPFGGQGGIGNNPSNTGLGNNYSADRSGSVGRGSTTIDLSGRTPKQIFKPEYNIQEEGRVVVKISVDRLGNVVAATTDGVKGSTTTNQILHQKAIEAARKCKFDVNQDAPPIQVGYISYNFILGD